MIFLNSIQHHIHIYQNNTKYARHNDKFQNIMQNEVVGLCF